MQRSNVSLRLSDIYRPRKIKSHTNQNTFIGCNGHLQGSSITLEDGTDRLSRNVGNTPDAIRPHLHCRGSLKSSTLQIVLLLLLVVVVVVVVVVVAAAAAAAARGSVFPFGKKILPKLPKCFLIFACQNLPQMSYYRRHVWNC